ncbi:MAG: hypothetical protein ABSH30_12840 [Acidimicrobiales bacterium]
MRRFVAGVYFVAAAFLVPWIAVLLRTQHREVLNHHSRLLWLLIGVLMVAGMLSTGCLARIESRYTVIAATFTATFLFVDAWFNVLTSVGLLRALLVGFAIVVQLPISVVSLVLARRVTLQRGGAHVAPRLTSVAFMAGAVLLVPFTLRRIARTTPIQIGFHQRIAWSGLDVFELAGLLVTGWCVRQRAPWMAMAGVATGTLLMSDAIFNIVTASSSTVFAALAMAAIGELPLCVLSFALAIREVRSWGTLESLGNSAA